jgi:ubiquinol-cytochrome c reductase cytochrome b subunit
MVMRGLFEWLHARTGYRAGLARVADEPLPPGTGWAFTLGSVLLFLLALQALTGAALSLYYAPTPDSAYQSVQYITREVPFGAFVRGLHHFGAGAMVIFAALHLLRVVYFGSYKAPREATWLSGVALLILVLAFALTGYLLPWDQRAYWATVVTVNITRMAPVAGDALAALAGARGGQIGALTLSRWFAIHAVVLPGLIAALVAVHLFLMRRHGISGPVHPPICSAGPRSFYPDHAARDLAVVLAVAIVIGALAWRALPPLERAADPSDATYLPRPEWYFLGLFQALKYMPGRLEIIGALFVPGLVIALLALLPWIDRGPDRDPRRRRAVLAGVLSGVLALAGLTAAGWRDRPESASEREWSIRETGGAALAESMKCARCHAADGLADPLSEISTRRPASWVRNHVVDPEVIAPGIRPGPGLNERDVAAVVAFARRAGEVAAPPPADGPARRAALLFSRHCIGCHAIDGDGGSEGPDLSRAGRERDTVWLARWISRPEQIRADADMPAFDDKLSTADIALLARFLAERR